MIPDDATPDLAAIRQALIEETSDTIRNMEPSESPYDVVALVVDAVLVRLAPAGYLYPAYSLENFAHEWDGAPEDSVLVWRFLRDFKS
jgi:hypothetical protein